MGRESVTTHGSRNSGAACLLDRRNRAAASRRQRGWSRPASLPTFVAHAPRGSPPPACQQPAPRHPIHAPETTHVTAELRPPPFFRRAVPGRAIYLHASHSTAPLLPPAPPHALVAAVSARPRPPPPLRFSDPPHPAPQQQQQQLASRRRTARHDRHGRRALRRGEGREERGGELPAAAGGAADVPAAGGAEGVGALVRARRRGRQHRAVRRRYVRQQLPRPRRFGSPRRRRRRRRLRRPWVPPPLRLPATQREPAPRPLVGDAAEAGSTCVGQSCARAPGLEAPDVHLAARRRYPPASQYAQPRAHRSQTRATIWIRENWYHLRCFRRWRQRAFISVHQEQHLRWRFRCSVWTPWSHAVRALHQLDHLLKQGRSPGDPLGCHRHQPRHRHPPARRQLCARRRVPHWFPPGIHLPDAPALRLDAALCSALRHQVHHQEVPALSMGSVGCSFCPRCPRIRRWDGDAFQRSERE